MYLYKSTHMCILYTHIHVKHVLLQDGGGGGSSRGPGVLLLTFSHGSSSLQPSSLCVFFCVMVARAAVVSTRRAKSARRHRCRAELTPVMAYLNAGVSNAATERRKSAKALEKGDGYNGPPGRNCTTSMRESGVWAQCPGVCACTLVVDGSHSPFLSSTSNNFSSRTKRMLATSSDIVLSAVLVTKSATSIRLASTTAHRRSAEAE